MGEDYFCPTCGESFGAPGKCNQCGSSLETIGEVEKDNGDDIDDRLLQGRSRGNEMGY